MNEAIEDPGLYPRASHDPSSLGSLSPADAGVQLAGRNVPRRLFNLENTAATGLGRPINLILILSTTAFTLIFAVWLVFGVLGIPIRKEFGFE